MTITEKTLTGIVAVLFIGLFAYAYLQSDPAYGSAPPGVPAAVSNASTTLPTVTSTASLVLATSTNCSARIIGTASSSIMLTFSDNEGAVPTAVKGFWQPASTTVAYDSGLYGCGAVKAWSQFTQSITVMETR